MFVIAGVDVGLDALAAVGAAVVAALGFLTKALLNAYKQQRDDYREWLAKEGEAAERMVGALVSSADALRGATVEVGRLASVVSRCPYNTGGDHGQA